MEYRILGKTGLKVSALAFGGNQIGSSVFGYKDDRKAAEAILKAIELGINFFDTADVYGERNSEKVLGQALLGRRHGIIISTKAGLTGDGRRNGHPEHLKSALEKSLVKLKTDYIDIFFLHGTDPEVPIEDSVGAIDDLMKEGKVRFAGVSHASVGQLEKITSFSSFAAVQDRLNIFAQESATEIIPFCQRYDIGFSAHSPLSSGLLAGKYFMTPFRTPIFFDYRFWNPEFLYLVRLKELAGKLNVSLPQLSLAWVLRHEGVGSVIMGTSSISQLEHNIGSLRIKLDRDNLRDIDTMLSIRSGRRHPIRRAVWKTVKYGIYTKTFSRNLHANTARGIDIIK